MSYIVELVTKESPYICLGYVKNTSIVNNKLEIGKEDEKLVVSDKETMDKVFSLISIHNSDRSKVCVMDWITEKGKQKRVFRNDIKFACL